MMGLGFVLVHTDTWDHSYTIHGITITRSRILVRYTMTNGYEVIPTITRHGYRYTRTHDTRVHYFHDVGFSGIDY